jgi:Glycosyltransferase 61
MLLNVVQRKIANEDDLLQSVSEKHGELCTVRGVQLDLLPVAEQLRMIGETDILVGMHGAGLSHVLFMPQHGALIELQPRYQSSNTHFADLALWRGLFYRSWKNENVSNEVIVQISWLILFAFWSRYTFTVVETVSSQSVSDILERVSSSECYFPHCNKVREVNRLRRLPEALHRVFSSIS